MRKFAWLTAVLFSVAISCTSALAQEEEEFDELDPLGEISLDMELVVGDLSKLSTGDVTQDTQKGIVQKLDDLIAKLEQECAACRGGASGSNPTRPLADSVIIGGPGGVGDLHAAKKNGKEWGVLPPKERERIVQSLTEGFPPHYQRILERYYKRLAEEAADADGAEKESEKESEEAGESESAEEETSEAAAADPVEESPEAGGGSR